MNAYGRVARSERNFLETSKSTLYIMSVELLAVKSGAQERGKGIKRWENGRRAGTVRMDKRVSPLQMIYTDTGFSRDQQRIHLDIYLSLRNLTLVKRGKKLLPCTSSRLALMR